MLDHFDEIRKKLESRGRFGPLLDEFREVTLREREKLRELEELRAEKNKLSEQFIKHKTEGKETSGLIVESKKIGEQINSLGEKMTEIAKRWNELIYSIPNIPHDSVPVGRGPQDNVVERIFGRLPDFDFSPEAHWDIGTRLAILDFERAAKITGSRFAVYFGAGALLERALINFMLDIHTTEKGFKEVIPPFIANKDSLIATGNLPKFAADLFKLELKDYGWYLIPTAEVPLTNIYRNETLDRSILPQRFVAYTPCFRSEAGSYGKDVRGLIRQHQFNKVELMTFSLPEASFDELERMTAAAEEVLKRLGLAYRVVSLCTADLGFASAKTYDLEVWMPSRKDYLEISSCSNCTDFQAGRANIRFRREPKAKPEFVHTLNGSGLAVGRTLSAILENYQQQDGSVVIPEALRRYMNGLEKIVSS
ncbi:MAG: serine--tRNA ligase [Candidatus Aminicenantes bacterium RBG_19FT_COMBO_58_17]|nr:MAG: serine--tRNA ligase [Candidatus Aminicenantes bacterium RBG_19FT_COMBO_58_17]